MSGTIRRNGDYSNREWSRAQVQRERRATQLERAFIARVEDSAYRARMTVEES